MLKLAEAKTFWSWFSENNTRFLNIMENDSETIDKLLDEVLENLAPYSNELFVYIGGNDNDYTEIIISADGDKDNFKIVKDLVAKAPKIDHWKMTPLIPPKNINGIQFDDLIIPLGDLAFSVLINPEDISLVNIGLYVKHYDTIKDHLEFNDAIERILDLILGEECYEYVTLTACKAWTDDTQSNISELRDYILGKVEAYNIN